MNLKTSRFFLAPFLLLAASHLGCQRPNYHIEVTPGQQGETEIRRVPYTAEELAARDREQKVRAALVKVSETPDDADLITLEQLWPKLSPVDRAALLETARRAAERQK